MSWTTANTKLNDNQTRTIGSYVNGLSVRGGQACINCSQLGTKIIQVATAFSLPPFPVPFSERIFHIIQLILDHLHPTLVDHLSPHLSTRPIRHLLWLSVSCDSQDSTIQGSSPHECDRKSSCNAFNAVVAIFHQIFFGFPSFTYVHEACPYDWSFLEGHSNGWSTYLSCIHYV